LLYYEKKLIRTGYDLIIGVDEAGRGPLAGPVVAAAVALKTFRFTNRIDDSKKLTSLSREKAFFEIINKSFFGIAVVGHEQIDRLNILVATALAMDLAIASVLKEIGKTQNSRKAHIIVDGNVILNTALPYLNIIRGDSKSKSIASASILAKVTRDRIMNSFDKIYPDYGFSQHKGYGTKAHIDVLKRLGPCPIHRKSFSFGA